MKLWRLVCAGWLLVVLAACGGGGGSAGDSLFGGGGGNGGGGGTTASASGLVVALDRTSVDNSGTQSVVATVTAVDASGATVAGVPVQLSVNNGAFFTPSGSVTDANGRVTATVAIGSNRTLRTIAVTASSGSVTSTSSFDVVGSASGGGVQASDLVVVLDRTTLPNSGGGVVNATVTALDASRNALSGVPVQVAVNSEAIATVSGPLTDETGVVTAAVSMGSNPTQRNVTVTATSGALVKSQTFQITAAAGGGGGATAADLAILLSKPIINNTGLDTATVTVTALDANRNALGSIPVTVSVNNNAVATVGSGATNAQGIVTATIGAGADASNRVLTITATAGAISRTASLTVAAGGGSVAPSDLTLLLSGSQVNNTGSESITATVIAVDGNRNALSGVQARFSIDNGGVIVPIGTATTTGSNGQLTASAQIGADRSTRNITVTATAGSFVRTAVFRVIGAQITSTAVPAVAATGSTGNQVQYRLVDNNANAMANQPITVTSSTGASATGLTGPNGDFVFTYSAPAQVGAVTFTATSAGETDVRTVQVGTSAVPLPPPGSVIESKSVSAAPNVVSVNTLDSTVNQSALRVLFLGAQNKPIPNVRVRFDLAGDANTVGGSFDVGPGTGSSIVYSGADGVATANYIPGQRSSPTNGLTIRACYSLTDVVDCSNSVTTNLTVVEEALSVTIGTDELIQEGTGTYIKDFVVLVVDAAGVAKSDITISPSVDVLAYYKGFYSVSSARWVQNITLDENQGYVFNAATSSWDQTGAPLGSVSQGVAFPGPNGTTVYRQPSCPNDDVNRNGARDTGEDLNNNLSLDPRKADVSIRAVGSNKTAANGTVVLRLEYPRDYATWVDFEITVQAGGISGTEGRTRFVGTLYGRGNLPGVASAFTNVQATPAFVFSPYGRSTTCQDAK